MKYCGKCKLKKDKSLFGKNKAMNDGLQRYCNECKQEHARLYYINNREKVIQSNKKSYKKNFIKNRKRVQAYGKNYKLQERYGISIEKYDEMYKEQDGKCFFVLQRMR